MRHDQTKAPVGQPKERREKPPGHAPAPAERRASEGRVLWTVALMIAALTLAFFLPALQNDFVNWDDYDTLVENPRYRGLSLERLAWMFTTFHMGHYQPLSWVTFGLDYLIWGMNPTGYHLTNLMLHVANAVLVYWLFLFILKLVFEDKASPFLYQCAAAFAALLFSLHPLRVESVVWITERRDVLSSFFLLGSVLCYLAWAAREAGAPRRWTWFAGSITFYGLSLLAKATGMTLPVVLALLDVYPLRRLQMDPRRWFSRPAGRMWLEKLPFAALALSFAIIALTAQKESGALMSVERYRFSSRAVQALYGVAFYPRKTLFPFNLSPLYEAPLQITLWDWPFLLSATAALVVTLALVALAKRWPAGLVAWSVYVAIVAPVLGFAQSGPQLVADRYSYLSCLGFAALAGAAALYVAQIRRRAHVKTAIVALCLALLLGLGWQTIRQIRVWRDSETLWHHALNINPRSRYAHYHLGNILNKERKYEEALTHYRTAITLSPRFTLAHYNLATVLMKRDQSDEAIRHFRAALEINPKLADAHVNLGNVLGKTGAQDKAMEHYRAALEIDGGLVEAHINLGLALEARGDLDGAGEHFRRALDVAPERYEAHHQIGRTLALQGRLQEGEFHLREALRLNPEYGPGYQTIGILLAARGDLEGAIDMFRTAIRIDPKSIDAHESLAAALEQKGDGTAARRHRAQADRLKALTAQ